MVVARVAQHVERRIAVNNVPVSHALFLHNRGAVLLVGVHPRHKLVHVGAVRHRQSWVPEPRRAPLVDLGAIAPPKVRRARVERVQTRQVVVADEAGRLL